MRQLCHFHNNVIGRGMRNVMKTDGVIAAARRKKNRDVKAVRRIARRNARPRARAVRVRTGKMYICVRENRCAQKRGL